MSDSEFDPDQQQTGHRQQKEELYQCRYHPGPLVHHPSQKLEDQSSTDHMVDKQRLHAELNGHLHSQVNFNRCHQVSQATIDRDSHTASASPELKSTRPEAVNERPEFTDQANSARAKLLEEIPGATNLDAIRRAYMKASGSPNRVCRICNKKFSSGRALGGHMRVHGPLFIQGSATRNLGVFHLAANCTQKQEGACEDDQEETTSIIDTFEDESDKERAQQYARSEQASLSSGAYAEEKLSCKDSYGVADLSMCGQERGLASFTCNAEFAGDGEGIVGSATSTDKKSLLYELRRNPKRSRWFAEQDFTLEAQQAFMNNFSTANSVSAEGARVVCSECGKAFCSERALFGHMRCHPEREWRGVLPPESSLEQRADAIARYRRKRALEAMKAVENSELKIIADVAREEDRDRTAELQVGSAGNSSLMKEAAGMVIRELDNVDGQEAKVSQSKVGYKELHECISTGDIGEVNIHAPRWRSNGRRSRRRVVNKAGIEETSSEEPALTSSESMHSLELPLEPDQLKGLDCLMLLAEAARKVEEEATSHNCQSQLGMEEHAYGFSLKELKSGFEGHQADKIRSLFDAGECDDDAADYEDEGDPAWAKRERLHKDLVLSSIGGKYECTTCKKSFSTHQALGGHRASHKKTKGCFARTSPSDLSGSEHLLADELDVSYVQEKDPSHSTPKKKKKQHRTQQPVFKGHECSICHRIFLTGQALGGHKRCHWAGEKPCETASVASTEKMPSLQSDEQCSKMVEGGIDLNVPASGDEDDETGYGMPEMRLSIGVESACEPVAEMKDAGVWSELSETKGTSKWAWTVKDMLIGDTSSSLANAAMGIEARRRFDGIWGQHWPNNNGVSIAQLPLPVCAVQSLV